jgi:hypothetical protein
MRLLSLLRGHGLLPTNIYGAAQKDLRGGGKELIYSLPLETCIMFVLNEFINSMNTQNSCDFLFTAIKSNQKGIEMYCTSKV